MGMHPNEKKILALQRRERVADMMLRCVPRTQIAAALGITLMRVCQIEDQLMDEWLKEDITTARRKRARYVRQQKLGAFLALAAFERSRQDAETITTEYIPRKCPDCEDGMVGANLDQWCPRCKGEGQIIVEHISRKVTGQAGDSTFLANYRASIAEAAKMEGAYFRDKVSKKRERPLIEQHLHIQGGIDYSKLPDQLLLEAKRLCLQMAKVAGVVTDNRDVVVIDVPSSLRENEP